MTKYSIPTEYFIISVAGIDMNWLKFYGYIQASTTGSIHSMTIRLFKIEDMKYIRGTKFIDCGLMGLEWYKIKPRSIDHVLSSTSEIHDGCVCHK